MLSFNVLTNSLPDPQSQFNEIGKQILSKAKLTKGTWFVIVMAFLILSFILSYSMVPWVNEKISLEKIDIRVGFYVVIIMAVVLGTAFLLPEIIHRWKDSKK